MKTAQNIGFPAERVLDAIFEIANVAHGEGTLLRFSRGPSLNDERDRKCESWDGSQAVDVNIFSQVNGN